MSLHYRNRSIPHSGRSSKLSLTSFQLHCKVSANSLKIWNWKTENQMHKMKTLWWSSTKMKMSIQNSPSKTCPTTLKMLKILKTTWRTLMKSNLTKNKSFTLLQNKSEPTTTCRTKQKTMSYPNATKTTSATKATSLSNPNVRRVLWTLSPWNHW